MNEVTPIRRAGPGRPTREQSEARHEELLESALVHFLDKGFEQATIEAIAQSVGMTKRTVYARYEDKVALFRAAVNKAIERYSVSQQRIEATLADSIEETLMNIARLRIGQVMTPNGLRLQRIINTESYRFPDIITLSYEVAAMPTMRFLAGLLERETAAGRLAINDPGMAASVFMSMVVSGPARIVVSGNSLPVEEIERRMAFAVRLFLDGARPRT